MLGVHAQQLATQALGPGVGLSPEGLRALAPIQTLQVAKVSIKSVLHMILEVKIEFFLLHQNQLKEHGQPGMHGEFAQAHVTVMQRGVVQEALLAGLIHV